MVIAAYIDSIYLPASQLFQSLLYWAEKNTADQFIIFCETEVAEREGTANMDFIDVKTGKTNLRLYYWYNFRLPSLLKKVKADVFITDSGICSLHTNIPQWIQLINTNFLNRNAVVTFNTDTYKRKHFQKISQAATGVMVREAYMADQLLRKYTIPAEKFHTTGEYFFNYYNPVSQETKNELLKDLTDGIEYFLCIGMPATKSNVMNVLKAFSLFKKRLKSGLKLVLALEDVSLEECVKDFRLYKYRDDVIVINEFTRWTYPQLLAASYAAIYLPSEITGYSERGLSAMQSATPVIATDKPEHHSLYKDAALFSDATDKSIADNMMLLYKDEQLRNSFIQKGLALSADCTLAAITDRLYQTIFPSVPAP